MFHVTKQVALLVLLLLLTIMTIVLVQNDWSRYSKNYPLPRRHIIVRNNDTIQPPEKVPEPNLENWLTVAERFQRRLRHSRGICLTKSQNPIKHWMARRVFLVDTHLRLLICAVPKSGSTSWHRTIWAAARKRSHLSENQNLYTPEDTEKNIKNVMNLNHREGDKLITSEKDDDDFMRNPPKNSSFRLILARHPFARFISGWNQKFKLEINYWVSLMKTFPKLLYYTKEIDPHRVVSFGDFARFCADNPRDISYKDPHFAPATKLCSPCQYNYTYIVKAESIDADEPWLMNRLGLSNIRVGRQGSGGSVVNSDLKRNIKRFMSKLSPSVIRGLYSIYKDDFEFFGYTFNFETLEAGGFD